MEVLITPNQGLLVRNPTDKQPLPEEGMVVSLSGFEGKYWRRRIACGDVLVGKPSAMVRSSKKKEEGRDRK